MFCLRSWIPILFFLTNASPIYLVLFISATYVLNRPCVYCSLLLAILVLSLFDFHTDDWFEPRYKRADSHNTFFSTLPVPSASSSWARAHHNGTTGSAGDAAASSAFNASMLLPDALLDTVALLTAMVNASVASALDGVVSTARATLPTGLLGGEAVDTATATAAATGAVSGLGFQEWAKAVLRKEWRIECLDLVIRL